MGTEDTPMPPGWYQDPWGPEGGFRYWSGTGWTQQVTGSVRFPEPAPDGAPVHAPDGDAGDSGDTGDTGDTGDVDGSGPGRRTRMVGIGGLVLAVLVVATTAVDRAGQDAGEISTPVLGVAFTSGRVEQAQPGLEARLADLERHAAQDPPDPSVPVTAVDLTGTWWSTGASYTISQYGAEVVVREINAYGTTGVGYGVFDGRFVEIRYEAVDGSFGIARFTLVDADTLSAVFRNSTHAVNSSAVLTRS
jgi:hypothetical protein